MITKYEYNNQPQLEEVLNPWTEEQAAGDRAEAEEAGLYFTADKGAGERRVLEGGEAARLRELMNRAGPGLGNAVSTAQYGGYLSMQQISLLFLLLGTLCQVSAQEYEPFSKYDDLSPDINLLFETKAKMSRFILVSARGYTQRAIIYDTETGNEDGLVSGSFFTQGLGSYFWDAHTKENYGFQPKYGSASGQREGWYTFSMAGDRKIVPSLKSRDTLYASNSVPYLEMDNERYLTAEYRGTSLRRTTKFKIVDVTTNKILWEWSKESDREYNLYWITGNWLLMTDWVSMAGIKNIDTIFNYETGETVSFAPECIIGYGDGVILTSLQTKSGFWGITVWSVDKKMLYRDVNFSLTAPMERRYTYGDPVIYFSYYDFPYIYCTILWVWNIGVPHSTIIMNLATGETVLSPEGYILHGIFDKP
jgi:hypothetical protein